MWFFVEEDGSGAPKKFDVCSFVVVEEFYDSFSELSFASDVSKYLYHTVFLVFY